MSHFGGTENPLLRGDGGKPAHADIRWPTGWAVTFKNVDTTSHILGHIVYVICAGAVTVEAGPLTSTSDNSGRL